MVTQHAKCPAGWLATGGGAGYDYPSSYVRQSGPVDDAVNFGTLTTGEEATGWYGRVDNDNLSITHTVYVYAICEP